MALAPLAGSSAIARFAEVDRAAQSEQAALPFTLTVPQQANLLEQCLPLFKEAASPREIKAQIAALCRQASEAGKHVHSLRVQAFSALTRLAASAHRGLFQLEIRQTMVRANHGVRSEQLGYRFAIDRTPVVADTIASEQKTAMLRFLREVDRAELPVTGEPGRERIGGQWADNTPLSRQCVDAHLLNRLVDALPDENRLKGSAMLDRLAVKIDDINTHAQCGHQQHVALGEKVWVLAEAFPEHAFSLRFTTRFSFDGGHYAVVLQPAANPDASTSTVPENRVLYETTVPLWERDQYAPMIVAAVQRHVNSALAELQPLLDLAKTPTTPASPTPNPYATAYATAYATSDATSYATSHADAQPKPHDKIEINILLKNALSALRDDYLSNLPGALNPDALLALHRSVGAIAVGDTTIGVLWELDKQVFDVDAEQTLLGLPPLLFPDPQRFA
jgi:hypothetical protein